MSTDASTVPQAPAQTPAPMTPTPPAAAGTSVMFGVTFTLNGTQVPVYAKDITHASTNGVEFSLPQPIDLGTFNDFAAWFQNQFHVAIPATDTLPPPLNEIAGKLPRSTWRWTCCTSRCRRPRRPARPAVPSSTRSRSAPCSPHPVSN